MHLLLHGFRIFTRIVHLFKAKRQSEEHSVEHRQAVTSIRWRRRKDTIECSVSCEAGVVIENPFLASVTEVLENHQLTDPDIDLIRRQLLLRLKSMDYASFVQVSATGRKTRVNFQWNIVYEIQSPEVHTLKLHTFNIPLEDVDRFRKSRQFWDKAMECSDLSKSNVEVLMEAAQVLYPRDKRESETWRIGIKRWPEAS